MPQSTSLNPKLSVHTNTRELEEIIILDPIEAYKAGYLDASRQMLKAQTQFVTTLHMTGWDDKDILKALMAALRGYTEGMGLENTVVDIRRNLPKKGVKNGSTGKTEKL